MKRFCPSVLIVCLLLCLFCTGAVPAHAEKAFSAVPMLAGGEEHTVALKNDGTVWAWGSYYHGQLGNGIVGVWRPQGSDSFQPTPLQVPGLDHMTAVAAGQYHTVALRSDGTVWAFGFDSDGQLGDGLGGAVGRRNPTPVQAKISNVTAIAAGSRHNAALQKDGTVWTWGGNPFGQLGHGEPGWESPQNVPAQVQNLDHVIAVAAEGNHTAALKDDGTVWSWGLNDRGQLGDGTGGWQGSEDEEPDFSLLPVQAQGLQNITAIAAGSSHTMALRGDGTVWVWGANWNGQTGNGTMENDGYRTAPVQVETLQDVTAIAAGQSHNVVLKKDGTIWAWGLNVDGQLGIGTGWNENGFYLAPVQTNHISGVVSIAAGDTHTLAMRDDGTVWAWGNNTDGQIGDGTVCVFGDYRPDPRQVLGPDGIGYLNLRESAPPPEAQNERAAEPASALTANHSILRIAFACGGAALAIVAALLFVLKKRRRRNSALPR